MRQFVALACATMMALLLADCSAVARKVNETWPPKTSCDKQLAAIKGAETDLAALGSPNAYIGINSSDLNEQVSAALARELSQVKSAHFSTRDQEARLDLYLDGEFDVAGKRVLLVGRFEVFATLHTELNHLILDPYFGQIKLRRVRYERADFPDQSLLVQAINAALKLFLNNINGALREQKILLAFRIIETLDPAALLRSADNVENVFGKPLKIDVQLARSAVLVDPSGIHGLAVLENAPMSAVNSVRSTPTPLEATEACDPAEFKRRYEAFRQSFGGAAFSLGTANELRWRSTSFSASKKLLADILNGVGQADCDMLGNGNCSLFGITYSVGKQYAHISPPLELKTESAPDLKCSQPQLPPFQWQNCAGLCCNCPGRGCPGSCDWWDAGCHAWKPTCEAIKAVEIGACLAGQNASKAACDLRNNLEKAAWDAANFAKQQACRANQEWLNAWQNTPIGDLAGTVALDRLSASLTLHKFKVSDQLETLTVNADIGGSGDVLADLQFLPKDIGHVLCQAAWNARVQTHTSAAVTSSTLSATLKPNRMEDGSLLMEADLGGFDYEIGFPEPPLASLLMQNPHVVIACTPAVILGLSGELISRVLEAFKVANRLGILDQSFKRRFDGLSFPIRLTPLDVSIPGTGVPGLKLVPTWGNRLVTYTLQNTNGNGGQQRNALVAKASTADKSGWWLKVCTRHTEAEAISIWAGNSAADNEETLWQTGDPPEIEVPAKYRQEQMLWVKGRVLNRRFASFCLQRQQTEAKHFLFDREQVETVPAASTDSCNCE